MKLFLTILFLSNSALAANFATIDELKTQVVNIYTDPKYCPSECVPIDGHDLEISDLNEFHAPIWEKATNELECYIDVKPEEKEVPKCEDAIKNLCPETHVSFYGVTENGIRAYCTRQLGVEEKAEYSLVESAQKKAAKLAKLKAEKDKADAAKLLETEALAIKAKATWTAAERDKLMKYLLSR